MLRYICFCGFVSVISLLYFYLFVVFSLDPFVLLFFSVASRNRVGLGVFAKKPITLGARIHELAFRTTLVTPSFPPSPVGRRDSYVRLNGSLFYLGGPGSLLNAACMGCSNSRIPFRSRAQSVIATNEIESGQELVIFYGDEARCGMCCVTCSVALAHSTQTPSHAPINPAQTTIHSSAECIGDSQYIDALNREAEAARRVANSILSKMDR